MCSFHAYNYKTNVNNYTKEIFEKTDRDHFLKWCEDVQCHPIIPTPGSDRSSLTMAKFYHFNIRISILTSDRFDIISDAFNIIYDGLIITSDNLVIKYDAIKK